MKIEKVVGDAMLLARESQGESESFGFPGVEDLLRSVAAECAARAIEETPRMALTGWKRIDAGRFSVQAEGRGILLLPEDWLLTTGLKLSRWTIDCGKILGEDHWLRAWQRRGWSGLRATPDRPLGFHTVSGGSPAVELVPAEWGDTLEGGWYIARPHISGSGEIEIPEAAYGKTLDHMVLILRQQATMR